MCDIRYDRIYKVLCVFYVIDHFCVLSDIKYMRKMIVSKPGKLGGQNLSTFGGFMCARTFPNSTKRLAVSPRQDICRASLLVTAIAVLTPQSTLSAVSQTIYSSRESQLSTGRRKKVGDAKNNILNVSYMHNRPIHSM